MIALDCEMSGLDPQTNSILSIGAVDLDDTSRKFYGECFLSEGKTFHVDALRVNGFTEQDLQDKTKKSLKELMTEFESWILDCKEYTLVGQNVSLDRQFLNTAFVESGIDFQFHYRVVDIHSVAAAYFLSKNEELTIDPLVKRFKLSLDAIAEKLNMPQEPRPHNALTGATYNAEIFTRLVYKKNLFPEFYE